MNRNANYRTEYIVLVTAAAICTLLKHVSTAFSENKRFKVPGAKFNQLMENVRGTY